MRSSVHRSSALRPSSRRLVAALAPIATAVLAVALSSATGATAAAPRASDPSTPHMGPVFTKTVAPVPSFLASTGGLLSLTQQTVAGLAAQRYGETPGLTAKQAKALPAGFLSSLTYPRTPTGAQPVVVASAVGLLAAGNESESSTAPGCSPDDAGNVSRVSVARSGSTYRLVITGAQRDSFAPQGSWRLPTYTTGGPTDVAVLDPNCGFDGRSTIAVTYPGGIDFFAYDGSGDGSGFLPPATNGELTPTAAWTPSDRILASAHVNADSAYFYREPDSESPPNVDNARLLAVTRTSQGAVTVHVLTLRSQQVGGSDVADSPVAVGDAPGAKPSASIAYANDVNHSPDYALAVRAGGTQSVWFGLGIAGQHAAQQSGACPGTGLPALSVADADAGDGTLVAVACANDSAKATSVERWSNYVPGSQDAPAGFPGGLHHGVSKLPRLTAPRPFATWPCELLSDYAVLQSPPLPGCSADMAADVIGTPAKQTPRIYQLPVLGRTTPIASRAVAGTAKGAVAAVDQLPLDDMLVTVRNTSEYAVLKNSSPVPLVYLMPAPMIRGLRQPTGGAPVSFGTTQGSGTGSSTSFATSVGGSVSATIGEPQIAAVDLSVSAEQATKHTDQSETQLSSTQSLNDNANEPFVVYQVTPMWQWTGTVIADSTGLGISRAAKVVTRIPASERAAPQLYADSVHQLAGRYQAFRRSGIYGPTLAAIFGPGVFGGRGATVGGADPAAYPAFVPGRRKAPTSGGQPYCDTHSGSSGVTAVNSGVVSPYTPPDTPAGGPSFLTPTQGYRTVVVGDSGSDSQSVTVGSSRSSAYASEFSVTASAGLTVGGVTVTADAGFSEGSETTVTTSSDQSFGVEIGHITGASRSALPRPLARAIDKALARTETYSWEPFICHRTTDLPGGGQTSGLVLGFATSGFRGIAAVPGVRAPRPVTGATTAAHAKRVAARSKLAFTRSGAVAAFRVQLQPKQGGRIRTLTTPVRTPAQAVKAARKQKVTLPRSLRAGVYRWRPVAVDFNGVQKAGGWRWIRIR
jgi:hypothetical protein